MTTKAFYDESYADETLGVDITDGLYHLRIGWGTVDEWDDGRPRMNQDTTIACGKFEGLFGPRIQLTLGGSTGVTQEGRSFEVTQESTESKFRVWMKALLPNPEGHFSNPGVYDATLLEEASEAIEGNEFIGRVNHKKGYTNLAKVHPLSDPPKGFKCECSVEALSL